MRVGRGPRRPRLLVSGIPLTILPAACASAATPPPIVTSGGFVVGLQTLVTTGGPPLALDYAPGDATGRLRIVMRIREPQANHDGGALRFGPDGYTYLALGDGGGANDQNAAGNSDLLTDGHTTSTGNGQDTSNVYGTLLRIDPRDPGTTTGSADPVSATGKYRVPTANPFAGATPGVDEIYAYGLRNPFRF